MYPFLMIISTVIGIPSDSLSIARGMSISHSYNNNFNLILGIGMHLFTSAIADIVFGFVIKMVNKFKITTFKKGNKGRKSFRQ
jgi:ABC-type transporter Mla maintaining outer membrane lipid asymmetry permease subunit MlaE